MYLKLLEKYIKDGILHLHLPGGKTYQFGDHGIEAHWYIKTETTINKIARDWEFQLGQTYMEGLWDSGEGELRDLLAVLRSNFATYQISPWLKPFAGLLRQWNKISRSYANVAHHYDVQEDVFRQFLDREMFYSCAYFTSPELTLEQAQQAKARHIASKLLIESGQTILDIGCGWGSLIFYLAEHFDIQATGITLSKEQLAVANKEATKRGLTNVNFELADYREHNKRYDRIVSVGMFEHVGKPFYQQYFEKVHELMADDGVALIHTIGRSGPPGYSNPWIHKYIFPGGSTPAQSEIGSAIEKSGLITTDIEVLRLHYAKTLRHWYERFQEKRETIAELTDEEFCRMWEFYLCICEVAFEYSNLVVYQMQLTKTHGAAPITRDYLYVEENSS